MHGQVPSVFSLDIYTHVNEAQNSCFLDHFLATECHYSATFCRDHESNTDLMFFFSQQIHFICAGLIENVFTE